MMRKVEKWSGIRTVTTKSSDLPTLVKCEAGHTPPLLLNHLSRFPILSIRIILWPLSLLQIQLRDLGERCKLPHRVRAEPGRQTYVSATEAETGHDAEMRALQSMGKYVYRFTLFTMVNLTRLYVIR